MTKTETTTPKEVASTTDALKTAADSSLLTDYESSYMSMRQFREQWEDFLDLAYSRLTTTMGYKSRVREGTLANLLWERSTRVVAQLPTGRVQALNEKNDIGKSMLMDVVYHKYIMCGANSQYSFLQKIRLWDFNSFIYGACPAMYDYRVDDEYTGPDWRVLDPRYVFPQAGRLSPNDSQRIYVTTYKGREWFKSKLGQKGWNDKALNKVLSELDDDYLPDNVWKVTNLQSDRGQLIDLHKGQAEVISCYERGKKGHWTTFVRGFGDVILRDIPNPHNSGRLPIVFKYCMPILDSIWGMGYVERGAALQKAIDTYVNMAMDFAKFKLYPPMWYREGFNASSNRYEPGAKWKANNGQDDFGFVEISQNYTQEFQNGYQFLKGALMNQNHAQDTTVQGGANSPDSQQGKTPAAISQNDQRENTGDNYDRSMLEEALEELGGGLINLLTERQPAPINFHIFDEDIQKIYDSGNEDVIEIFDSAKSYYVDPNQEKAELQWKLNGKGAAKVTVKPKDVKGTYLYRIDTGTTMAKDDQTEHDNITEILQFLGTQEGQAVINALPQSSDRQLDLAELFKRYLITSGLQDWEKILPEVNPQDQAQQQQQPQAQQFSPQMLQDPQSQAMYQQMQQQQQQTIPQQMPSIALSGKLDDRALAGAEQMAGLPVMSPQQHAQQQQQFIQSQPQPVGAM
jgi:hypothetical protein